MIYLDSAATSFHKPRCVTDAVVRALSDFGNPSRGAHSASLDASRTVYETRRLLSSFFNAPSPERVVFTSNSTEALNTALYGLLSEGDGVITTDAEHNSVLRPLYDLERRGVITLDFVHCDEKGNMDYAEFERLIRKNTRLIVMTHASNVTGTVYDISLAGRIAREHGLLFVVDASQSAGIIPIDIEEAGISVLCFTGHKSLLGPQGTGGMCIADGVEIAPLKRGGTGVQSYLEDMPSAYPVRLEAGTLNSHSIAGLNASLRYILDKGIDTLYREEMKYADFFYESLRDVPSLTFYGDMEKKRTAIVSLNVKDYSSSDTADYLASHWDIAVRAGAHCAPRMHRALGTEKRGVVRFSFSPFNTLSEVETAVDAIREIAL